MILFPAYNKKQKLDISKAEERSLDDDISAGTDRLRSADEESTVQRAEIAQSGRIQAEKRVCEQNVQECKLTLAKKFLVFQIHWRERGDVDLIVVDPDGNRFSPEKNNRNHGDFPRSTGQLSVDMKTGPGMELWQDFAAPPGDYKVIYHVAKLIDPSVKVSGWYIQRSTGLKKLRDRTIEVADSDKLAATVTVSSSGSISVVEAN
jgi:hypothetical protein